MLKQIRVQLYPPEWPPWHGNIKEHWRSSAVFIVNFETMPHLFLVFHRWIWGIVASCLYQQKSKYRQVKITKHASTGTNYAILTKVQHEKKPVTNLKIMQIVGFGQTSTKFIEIFVVRLISLYEKNRSGNHLSGCQQ